MGLFRKFRKRKKKPTLLGTRPEQLAPPERPLINPIPWPPITYDAPTLRDSENMGRAGPRPSADYRQYEIQDPRWSESLRRAFDLTGGAGFALASEIVPVHIVAAGERPGEHNWIASVIVPSVTGEFGMVRLTHLGTRGVILLDRCRPLVGGRIVLTLLRPVIGMQNFAARVFYGTPPAVSGEVVGVRGQSTATFVTQDLYVRSSVDTTATHSDIQLGGLAVYPGGDILIAHQSSALEVGFVLAGRLLE